MLRLLAGIPRVSCPRHSYFNDSVAAYVTTYRCGECWIPSLEETRARLASTKDEAEIMSAGDFFHRHGVYVMEFMRGDPASDVQKVLLRLIELLRSEDLTIGIGRGIPMRSAGPKSL